MLIVDRRWFKKFLHFLTRKSMPKNKFKQIEQEILQSNKDWFKVLQSSPAAARAFHSVSIPA